MIQRGLLESEVTGMIVRLDPKRQNVGYITHTHLFIKQEMLVRMCSWLAPGLHLSPGKGESPL